MRPHADYFDEKEETPWGVMRKAHQLGIGASAAFSVEYGAAASTLALPTPVGAKSLGLSPSVFRRPLHSTAQVVQTAGDRVE